MTTSPHTTPEATDRERRDLFDVLPPSIRKAIEGQPDPEDLLEVVLDLGRPPQARFAGKDIHLGCADVSREDLDHVCPQ